jgi:hypothetical protein
MPTGACGKIVVAKDKWMAAQDMRMGANSGQKQIHFGDQIWTNLGSLLSRNLEMRHNLLLSWRQRDASGDLHQTGL